MAWRIGRRKITQRSECSGPSARYNEDKVGSREFVKQLPDKRTS